MGRNHAHRHLDLFYRCYCVLLLFVEFAYYADFRKDFVIAVGIVWMVLFGAGKGLNNRQGIVNTFVVFRLESGGKKWESV